MERFNTCSASQKEALKRLYDYLGFNEVCSFEEFLTYMFKNTKSQVDFANMFNHSLKHIVSLFWIDYPEYKSSHYIKYFWLNESDLLEHMNVGSKIEFDPKGVVRLFVKENFNRLLNTKV